MLAGGCFCGAVRYETTAEPTQETICHCADCRRISGAPAVAWFTVPRAGLRLAAGEPARFRSSDAAVRSHCATCGTTLFFEADASPDSIDVTIASLDEEAAQNLPPKDHTHAAAKLGWVALTGGLPVYPGERDAEA